MNRFVLIDGNALVHRAYHALPPLTKNGEAVNAVYGFFSMFLKIVEDIQPQYIAVCFDRKAPTFRKQLYVGYQAHRPKMADDLSSQFVLIHKILEKSGVQIFEVDGYEADDLIGTISQQVTSNKRHVETIIVSGDRDLLQLVNSHVRMLAPITGITNMVIFDEAKVKEKYGLVPSQFIDYKALVGDASDGYPGVSGVGPKTASALLNKYGTFENIYQHLGDLSPKLSQALATDAEQAALAKKLATIATDAPIQFDIKKCSIEHFDMAKLKKEFERYEFNSLLKRLGSKEELEAKPHFAEAASFAEVATKAESRDKEGTEETLRQAQGKQDQNKQKKAGKQTLSDQLGLL